MLSSNSYPIESATPAPSQRTALGGFRFTPLVAAGLLLLGPSLEAGARAATVTSDEGRVVAEGEYVRIESAGTVTEVQGDWRTAPGVNVTITGSTLLAELGAVEAADHLRLSLAGDILFAIGSAVIDEAAASVLAKVAQVIRERAVGEVLVVGHTDSAGGSEANQRLSEARALAVIRWLEQHQRIPASIFLARGMGERQPIAHETTPGGQTDPTGRARNRRVELFLATTPGADVRVAAGLVTVDSPAGAVHVREDSVEVAGVRIDGGGVQVGGVSIAAGGAVAAAGSAAGTGDAASCAAGRHCNAGCPDGNCRLTCPAGAICDFSCQGGDCTLACAAGAHCDLSCAGGNCTFSCAGGSNCKTTCTGGDCRGSR